MSKTFEFQEQLETLPLSNLKDAGANFLNWVEPLINKEQFATTKNSLENFMNKDGLILEKKLTEWSDKNEGNWLAPLWRDMYLDIREPVVIDVNYFVKLDTKDIRTKYTSSDIAGVMINRLFTVYESICSEEFKPEMIRNTPICMAPYKEMFKATRIPKLNSDEYIVKPKAKTSHIIVMYKNNMFKLDLTNEDGKSYSSKTIINTLNKLQDSKCEVLDTNIGVVTTAPRDSAAILLEKIIQINTNNQSLEVLKDALFMVCIDEDSKNLHEFAMSLIGSNESNRYFDKNLQLIFNKNGDFGFNLEHTGADAGAWINIINMVNDELKNIDTDIEDTSKEIINYTSVSWKFTSEIKTQLNELKAAHHKKLDDLHFEIMHFESFGTTKIKSLKSSPDAFLQLALQLAQYRTFKKLRSTYEAVANRTYLNGRTECTRPISMEVLNFVKAFEGKKTDKNTLKQMMSDAGKKHSSRIKDCLGSNGVERYFYALKSMYNLFGKELGLKEMPEFFNDFGYKQLTYSYISTSRIESKYFDLGGFGPVVPDGYGFWYNLLENRIDMNLITMKSEHGNDVKSFGDEIIKSINDLVQLNED